jgi:hypothetical protein
MKKTDTKIRVCNNKTCQKSLPVGYKHRYCEACRNLYIQKAKNIGKGAAVIAGSVASVAILIVTGGKINLKK